VPFGSLKWLFLGHVFNQHGISVDPKNVFFFLTWLLFVYRGGCSYAA
jgi:uncharacterized transporter YbjL